jgi:glycosyltransferase involved in cell wall biosynthesis
MQGNRMIQPLVSIIIPIYNVDNYIEECLQSVLKQTYTQYEVVLVNDGSTDKSASICEAFIKQHPQNFKLIHKKNGGLSDARNVGVKLAKGVYLIFIDSDDYVSSFMLEKLVTSVTHNNADIACCGITEVTETGEKIRGIPANSALNAGSYSFLAEPYVFSKSLPNAWNKIYKKNLFTENNITFPKGLWYEDLATIPKLFYFANSINFINDELYNYRYREGAITKTYSLKILDIFTILGLLKQFFNSIGLDTKHIQNSLNTLYINHTVVALSRLVLVNDQGKQSALLTISRETSNNIPPIIDLFSSTYSPVKYKALIALLKICGVKSTYVVIKCLVKMGKIKP